MKKTLRMIGALLVAVMVAGTFTACSEDDGDENLTHDSQLVGTWQYTEPDDDGSELRDKYEFKKDGSFVNEYGYYVGNEVLEDYYVKDQGLWETFETNGATYLMVQISNSTDEENIGGTATYEYSFQGKNIVNIGGVYYSKK